MTIEWLPIVARLTAPETRFEVVDARRWTSQKSWGRGIRRLAEALPEGETPLAVAAFRVRAAN